MVGSADHVEEQFAAELAGRDVAQLVEHQQVRSSQLLLEPAEFPFLASLHQLRDQLGDAVEADVFATAAGLDGQSWKRGHS